MIKPGTLCIVTYDKHKTYLGHFCTVVARIPKDELGHDCEIEFQNGKRWLGADFCLMPVSDGQDKRRTTEHKERKHHERT